MRSIGTCKERDAQLKREPRMGTQYSGGKRGRLHDARWRRQEYFGFHLSWLPSAIKNLAMHKYKDFKKAGMFRLASGLEVFGELVLKGGATSLDMYSDSFFDTHESRDITGTFHDRLRFR